MLVQVLLDKGADCNARTCDGDSCLAVAAANGSVAVVQQLLAHGTSVNLRGGAGLMPLHHAAMRQDEFSAEIVQMLLDKGAESWRCWLRRRRAGQNVRRSLWGNMGGWARRRLSWAWRREWFAWFWTRSEDAAEARDERSKSESAPPPQI